MNERIFELAEQAEILFSDERVPETSFEYRGAMITPGDLKKFAELMIKASFDVVINDGRFHDAKGIIRAGKYTAMEHFGVEECT